MQSVMHLRRSVFFFWFGQYNQNKEAHHREVPELCEADLTNVT